MYREEEGLVAKTRPVTAAPTGAALRKIRDALARVPLFERIRFEDVEVHPLNSFTNLSYKLVAHGNSYVLRVAGKGTSAYIDRSAEEHNARIAAAAGLSAEVLFFDPKDGTMLSGFIDGTQMDEIEFHRDPTAIVRAARTLRRVHGLRSRFRSRFGPLVPTDYYLGLLRGMHVPLPDAYRRVQRQAEAVRVTLRSAPARAVPCHNDTCTENFLEVDRRVYLLDWEYSGMNDPMWDLGNLSVEAGFDADQERAMMEAYCEGEATRALYGRMVLQKAMSDYFWGIWSVVQHANSNPAADFLAYATGRFERCKAQMETGEFGDCLDAVRTGRAAER
jgi:thiamine kinase-like enzyme